MITAIARRFLDPIRSFHSEVAVAVAELTSLLLVCWFTAHNLPHHDQVVKRESLDKRRNLWTAFGPMFTGVRFKCVGPQ
jgi:hypothetical protein